MNGYGPNLNVNILTQYLFLYPLAGVVLSIFVMIPIGLLTAALTLTRSPTSTDDLTVLLDIICTKPERFAISIEDAIRFYLVHIVIATYPKVDFNQNPDVASLRVYY